MGAAVLDSSDPVAYAASLRLIRELDFDVLVPWAASRGGPHVAVTDRDDARRRIDALLTRLDSSLAGMDTGIGYFPTHDATGPGEVARLVEEHGHAAIYFAEHTHIPAAARRRTPGGGELPRRYAHTYDLFVALTAAAAATSHLRDRQRDLPRRGARPDHHRQGGRERRPPLGRAARVRRRRRLEPRGDANHGTDPRTRMALLRERVEAMKAIWTQDEASYHGALRGLRADLVVAQARPAAASAGAGGRQRARRARPRARVRRRLVPQLVARGSVLERIPELREQAGARDPRRT